MKFSKNNKSIYIILQIKSEIKSYKPSIFRKSIMPKIGYLRISNRHMLAILKCNTKYPHSQKGDKSQKDPFLDKRKMKIAKYYLL